MSLINPVLADVFVRIVLEGATPSFKADELSLWRADPQASDPETPRSGALKAGMFANWFRRKPLTNPEPCI